MIILLFSMLKPEISKLLVFNSDKELKKWVLSYVRSFLRIQRLKMILDYHKSNKVMLKNVQEGFMRFKKVQEGPRRSK